MSFKNADVSTKEGVKETMRGFNLMGLLQDKYLPSQNP